jgi:nucleoside diphosphate kinase
MMGGSDPAQRAAWTIRGTWTTPDMPRWENLVHGSDSSEAFERESYLIKTWHSCSLNP